jgi:hypothetical protein
MDAVPPSNCTHEESVSDWPRGAMRWVAMAAISLISALIFLPTVPTHFDFADDGAFVHSQGVDSFLDFNRSVWTTTLDEFYNKGPYRPVAWYFWIGGQEVYGENPLLWRLFRFGWSTLAAGTFLLLLSELGFGFGVSILTTVLAMWNPYRAEVWMSLTHCEGIAMPFAMVGLVCAYRAARSDHPWRWDLAAMLCALLAVGCKNVFAVVIPAQMFLRVCHPGLSLWAGIKQFGGRAAILSLVVVFPVVHFVCYRLTMHANRYDMAWEAAQLPRLLNGFLGAMNKDFLGPAWLAAILLVALAQARGWMPTPSDAERVRFRAACGAGLILFLLGFGVYAPMNGVSGRYMMPGAWGLDLLAALLWSNVVVIASPWRRLAYVLLAGGLLVTAVSMVGKQEKYFARIANLWDAVDCVEKEVPHGARIGWAGLADRGKSDDLEYSDGVHFAWHLNARGRRDLQWQELPASQAVPASGNTPQFLVTSDPATPSGTWKLLRHCQREYWFGRKQVNCFVWQRIDPAEAAPVPALPTSRTK